MRRIRFDFRRSKYLSDGTLPSIPNVYALHLQRLVTTRLRFFIFKPFNIQRTHKCHSRRNLSRPFVPAIELWRLLKKVLQALRNSWLRIGKHHLHSLRRERMYCISGLLSAGLYTVSSFSLHRWLGIRIYPRKPGASDSSSNFLVLVRCICASAALNMP